MKRCKRIIDISFLSVLILLLISLGVFANTGIMLVPNWGTWSIATAPDYKQNNTNHGIMGKYSSAWLDVYGDFVNPGTTTRITLTSYRIPDNSNMDTTFYASLYYQTYSYWPGKAVSARLRSSSIEPSVISTVYDFRPDDNR